jgi:amino acid transporter
MRAAESMSESPINRPPSPSELDPPAPTKSSGNANGDIANLAAEAVESEIDGPSAPPHASADAPAEEGPVVTTIGAPEESAVHKIPEKVKTLLVGKPRDLADQSVFHHVSLVAFLAWVGLGADGLSSSCYGPPEAFKTLSEQGDFAFLAIFLSLATILTVFVISACYRHIIEEFPSGGGGYLVASKLLHPRVGVVSGCALLVDYVLTVTVSIAAAGDALFGIAPFSSFHKWKIEVELAAIILLLVLNLRGIKESVKFLLPVFIVFLITHAILIFGSVGMHLADGLTVVHEVANEVQTNLEGGLGLFGMLALLMRAYTMGAGTYTGIEAVSNSMPVMREPRVATAKRTMTYMAFSLAVTAGGLMIAYLLLGVRHSDEFTMNQILSERFVADLGLSTGVTGPTFVWVTILAEALLLFVAAQAGFIDGPRVLANMAHDSWMPHWFANLSERLATHNGVMLMGLAAITALVYTGGNVTTLVIMYSINVFLTFSLSMIGMVRHWWQLRHEHPWWRRRIALFSFGTLMCVSILCATIYEKFDVGGWRTLGVTGLLVALCFATRRHYDTVINKVRRLDETLGQLSAPPQATAGDVDPKLPTAVILVGGYSGLGVHTLLNAVRFAPGHFKNMVFISVAVVDSGNFKGAAALEDLRQHTEESLAKYVDLARRLGMPATSYMAVGTEPVHELEQLCLSIAKQYPKVIFFAGQLLFEQDTWYHRLLHNQTAFSLQRRLQWVGLPMVILPTRVR